MNAHAKKWIKELRSGKYRKIQGQYYDGWNGRCALGIFVEKRLNILKHLGLTMEGYNEIMDLNDKTNRTFDEIADIIETHAEHLFWEEA